ncbi:serine carboxypeptidase-like 20 [Malania oleifera]|uniref:serine carboxypeptidase-like 20 n=1 Tax=Malania oleifera TaxID=397392 RepID=UPI0025ADEC3A|nr:serine carboxypeptidase-like 20 [Malania oleifera]
MRKALCEFLFCSILTFVILWDAFIVEGAPQGSQITNIPGFKGTLPSKHYSGYQTIDGNAVKNLFYYFVESEGNPKIDPLVLWLNGGPGCSSFDGFIYEHGPFNFQAGETKDKLPTLHLNPYSWSKVSNIIYLDSPAGVGFSYSTNRNAYTTGDVQTALDTHNFLLQWFKEYQEFQANPFYIAGESYAGIYVPTLAIEIVKGIQAGAKPIINFKGYMVGNACTDDYFDGYSYIPFAHGMALISDAIFEDVLAACGAAYYNITSRNCERQLDKVDTIIDGLNIYNILEPCYHNPDANGNSSLPSSFKELGRTDKPLGVRKIMYSRAWPFRALVPQGIVTLWPQLVSSDSVTVPCVNDEIATKWLNDAEVKKAIHAENSIHWVLCTNRINYSHDTGSMIDYHKKLTTQGYKALVYSGDHDMRVPFTGSQAWTESLGFKVVDEWRPWWSRGQVAGYMQGYDHNFTFLTIKGAGHNVPENKPIESLDFYSRWLEGKPI